MQNLHYKLTIAILAVLLGITGYYCNLYKTSHDNLYQKVEEAQKAQAEAQVSATTLKGNLTQAREDIAALKAQLEAAKSDLKDSRKEQRETQREYDNYVDTIERSYRY